MPNRAFPVCAAIMIAAWATAVDAQEPAARPVATVVEMTTCRDSSVTSAWMANGIRIQHRQMVAADKVVMSVHLWGSELLEDANSRGISRLTAAALGEWEMSSPSAAGVVKAERCLPQVVTHAMLDNIELRVSCPTGQARVCSSILAEALSSATIDARVLDAAKQEVVRSIAAASSDRRANVLAAIERNVFPPGEPRLAPVSERRIRGYPLELVRQWLDRHVKEDGPPIEMSIVGNITLGDALEIADRVVGRLPRRERASVQADRKLRNIARPLDDVDAKTSVPRIGDKAVVIRGFFGPNIDRIADQKIMRAASAVLGARLKKAISENAQELGGADPSCMLYPVPLCGYSMLIARVDITPGREAAAVAVLEDLFNAARVSIGADELNRDMSAQSALLASFRERPEYWTAALMRTSTFACTPQELVDSQSNLSGVTAEEIKRLLTACDIPGARIRIRMRPSEIDDDF